MEKHLFLNKNIYIIFGVTLFAVMGVASITPVFPSIIKHFNLTVSQIGLLITVFTIPGVVLAPFMGILADKFGRKQILLPSLLIFGIAGFLCVFQTDYQMLLFYRFLQGIGAASLGSLNVTIIGDLFKGNDRVTVMGYNASVLSIGTASYPIIGGFLGALHWSYIFYLPVLTIPFGIIIFLGLKNLPKTIPQDFTRYLKNVWLIVNQRKVWGYFILSILLFFVLYGTLLSFFPLLMDKRFGVGPAKIGLFMSLMSFTTAICSSQLGRIRRIISAKKLLIVSVGFYFIALLVLGFAPNYLILVVGIILFGLGHGLLIPNIQTELVSFAPASERAAFMSINSMVLRIGQSLGPVVVGLFYFWKDISIVFYLSAIIPVLMIGIIQLMINQKENKY